MLFESLRSGVMSKNNLFIVEVRDESNKPKTYRIVKARDKYDAKNMVYYALEDQGIECSRNDLFAYECIGG